MNLQEQHWNKLFAHLTTEGSYWYGLWTVYSPEKAVIKTSQGIRILQSNREQTVIIHTNQFPSPDGTTLEKKWQIEKETCNQIDGLAHPADPAKRALSLTDGGATAWVPKTLESGCRFAVELFLKHQDWNSSLGSIYNESGCLEKILHIWEHLGSFPPIPAEPELEQLSGKWIGKTESMSPDLKVSTSDETHELILDPTQGKNQTFYLPNGIVLNIPKKVKIGEEFEIVAGQLVSDNEYKRLTAKYDNLGTFSLLVSEVFHRVAEKAED